MRLTSLCAISALALCFGCEDKPAPAPAAQAAAEAKPAPAKKEEAVKPLEGQALADLYVKCWNSYSEGSWDKFTQCYSKDAVSSFVDSGMPDLKGSGAILANAKEQRAAFPDTKGAPEIVLLNGREVATIGLISGTNKGAMKNPDGSETPATNKAFGQHVFHGLTFNEKNQGAKEVFIQDITTMMGQLGLAGAAKVRSADAKAIEGAPIVVIAKNDATEKANVATVTKQWDDFGKEDLKAIEAGFTDDAVESDQGDPEDRVGKKAVMDSAKRFLAGFGSLKSDCQHLAAGDYVASTCKVSATNDGDMPTMGLKKTGKTVNMTVVEVTKLKEGKISNVWRFYNGMAMAQQLGLIPEQPAATAKAAEPVAGEKAAVQPAAAKTGE